jgi:hypothetical protein
MLIIKSLSSVFKIHMRRTKILYKFTASDHLIGNKDEINL